MAEEYGLRPTHKKYGSERPIGWVHLEKVLPKSVRTITEGYLNQRMPKNNTIRMNQHYVSRIMENPRTPAVNRRTVIDYVVNHQEKFIPLCEQTEDPEINAWAEKKNAGASRDFMREFRRKYMHNRMP